MPLQDENENWYIFTQEMTNREYVEDQDAEEPDDFVISLTTQVHVQSMSI